jgi:phosphatidylserine decarboxylase
MPINAMTKLAGSMAIVKIPESLRSPIFGLYSWVFGCNLAEAEPSTAKGYTTFQSFFTRRLQEGARPVDLGSDLVSPADGCILSMGRIEVPLVIEAGQPLAFPEQIKGVSYPLQELVPKAVFERLTRTSKPIHYCTIYLSPGDYHRFHSPASWTQDGAPARIHGEVLSVAPYMMRWVRGLLCLNERTVLGGSWKYGAFAMIPVGATNVSSIDLEPKAEASNAKYEKGEPVGTFKLGSTVVLLFHAPEGFRWSPESVGEKIRMGQSLGTVPRSYRFISGLL